MSNRAWMPLHIGDYLSDTGHLTATEHGAYLLMIMHYWQNGCLPDNERVIARIAKLTPEQWEESRDILAMLFGPGWTHKRIDAELSKADEIIEKRRAAAESRFSKGKMKESNANAVHVHSKSSDTRVPPLTDNQDTNDVVLFSASDDLESKLLEAAGEKIHPHGAIVVGPIISLLAAGADLELDVLPTIRATAARLSQPARSWAYFVPAIQTAFDRRVAAGKWTPAVHAQPPPKLTAHQQRHQAAMNAFDRQLGIRPDDEFTGNTIDLAARDFGSH